MVPWAVIEVDAKYSTGVIIPSERCLVTSIPHTQHTHTPNMVSVAQPQYVMWTVLGPQAQSTVIVPFPPLKIHLLNVWKSFPKNGA